MGGQRLESNLLLSEVDRHRGYPAQGLRKSGWLRSTKM